MDVTYHCQYCEKSFSDPRECRKHEEDDHIHTISILGDYFGGSWGTPFRGMTKDQQQYYPTVVYMVLSNGEVAQYVLRDVKNKLKDFPDARVYNNVD